MKYLKFLLLIPLAFMLTGSVTQQMLQVVARKNVAAGGYTYLVEEDFEGTGTEAGWTNSGTAPDWDYTTTPPEGSESWRRTLTGQYSYDDITAEDSVTMCFMLYLNSISSWNRVVQMNNSFTDGLILSVNASTGWRIYHGTVSDDGAGSYSTATLYYCWLEYTKSTATNGVAKFYVSTTTTKPGSPECETAVGNATVQVDRIFLGTEDASAADQQMDHIRVISGVSVTDWPE